MTNPDQPSAPPTLTLVEKLHAVHNINTLVPEKLDLAVTYAINGLSDKYGCLAQIIAHKEPFPDLSTVRSMVSTEVMRIRNKSHSLSVSTNSSAPQVLLTEKPRHVQDTRTNKERDNNKTEVCRNFGRGVCRWGATC
ncbi:hybrid signal transduction histidine kinase M, partial [Tanacetum coccineum]